MLCYELWQCQPKAQWGLCSPEQMAAEHEGTDMHSSTQPVQEVTYLLPCSGGLTQPIHAWFMLGLLCWNANRCYKNMRWFSMPFTEDLGFDHIGNQNFILFYIIQLFTASGLADGFQEPFLTVISGWRTMGPWLKIFLHPDKIFHCEFI